MAARRRHGGARSGPNAAPPGPAEERVLVLDAGNSKTAYAVFEGGRLRHRGALAPAPHTVLAARRQLAARLRRHRLVAAGWDTVLASVVPAATVRWARALLALTGKRPLVVGVDRIPGLRVLVPEPRRVGADRLANALGAVAVYGAPAIVVDLGTATTLDAVDAGGRFVGGAIAPGAVTAAAALYRAAARLQPVPLRAPRRPLGRNTAEALRAGIVLGHAGLVDALVGRIARELGSRPRVVATGGLAGLIAPHCATVECIDPTLTLRGLYEAHARRRGRPGGARAGGR